MSVMEEDYYYARYHEGGPGAWCVSGPNDFCMYLPTLDKLEAYTIAKILSHKYQDAIEALIDLKKVKSV